MGQNSTAEVGHFITVANKMIGGDEMSVLRRRLNKLEEVYNASSGIYSIEIGYTEDEEERALWEAEAYEELECRCNGSVRGLVCFITNYRDGFRWRVPGKQRMQSL